MILDDGNFEIKEDAHPTHKWFLWSTIPLFILTLICYTNFGNSAIDFQMHDTYVVIALIYFPLLPCLLMLFYSVVYFIMNYLLKKPLNKKFSLAHFFMTWIPLLAFLSLPLKLVLPSYSASPIFTVYNPLNMTAFIYFTIFFLGVVIFLFNFFRSFFISLYSK